MGLQKKKFHKATGLTCMVAKCDPITAVSTYASDNLLPCHTFWTYFMFKLKAQELFCNISMFCLGVTAHLQGNGRYYGVPKPLGILATN